MDVFGTKKRLFFTEKAGMILPVFDALHGCIIIHLFTRVLDSRTGTTWIKTLQNVGFMPERE